MPKKNKTDGKKNPAMEEKKSAQYSDQTVATGTAGEVHQTAGGDVPLLTTQQGVPVSDDQNSLKIGARGPTALEDFHFREKLFHFDLERIPERVVYARGFGAHGYFENYESLADITKADLFKRPKEKTPVFVRFSTAAGNKGSAEPAARDFVADAFAYMKFIGHTPAAAALFEKAGLPENRDHGFITINGESDCSAFVTACRKVRYWDRPTD